MRAAIIALLIGAMGYNDTMPPPEYRGDVQASVFFLSPADVDDVCGNAVGREPGVVYFACSRPLGKGRGIIVLPNPCAYGERGERFAELACHEIAHVNGWIHD